MNNDDAILRARLKDLAQKSYKTGMYTYSTFLNPAELFVVEELKKELEFIDISVYGGYEMAERCMAGFGSADMFGYEGVWPIKLILIEPLIDKFADSMNHRDFLGSVMNLGIDRSVLGDILVKDGKRAYVFCVESIAKYICDNLKRIKHTNVRCTVIDDYEGLDELKPVLESADCIVASNRFDAIIAAVTRLSRNEVIRCFQEERVSLNGRINTRNSMALKPGDIFSVRGYGKYRFGGADRETRKGRIYIKLDKYT